MGALPDRLPGFQHVENAPLREKFEAVWGVKIPPTKGWHLPAMFDAMERDELKALYVIGENPMRSEADQVRTRRLLEGLDCLVVQDISLTATAEVADVVGVPLAQRRLQRRLLGTIGPVSPVRRPLGPTP